MCCEVWFWVIVKFDVFEVCMWDGWKGWNVRGKEV